MRKISRIFVIAAAILVLTACGKSLEEQVSEQLEMAESYLKDKNYTPAIEAYLKAIELDPKTEYAYTNLSWIYRQRKQNQKMIEILEKGIEELPGNENILQIISRVKPPVSCSAEEEIYEDRLTVELFARDGCDIFYSITSEYNPGYEEKYEGPFELERNGDYHLTYYAVSEYGTKGDVYEQDIKIALNREKYHLNDWYEKDGLWYYNDSDGYPVTGWQEIDGKKYYFYKCDYIHEEGSMVSSAWLEDCYLGADGAMLIDEWTPSGYYVGKDGKWDPDVKKEYDVEIAPYKEKLDAALAEWPYDYKNGGIGITCDIEQFKWTEHDAYYTLHDVYLGIWHDSDGMEGIVHFDELRILKYGTYTCDGVPIVIEDWLEKYYLPRWQVYFDDNGYISEFYESSIG